MDDRAGKSEAGRPGDHAPGDWAQWLVDLRVSVIFLTRLPVAMPEGTFPPLAAAARAFGPAGALIGAVAAGVFYALQATGVPAGVAVAVMLAVVMALTGGLHEDGLADTADGFGGGASPQRRLEIMRDSHIGSYGVLALALALLIRWAALVHIAAAGAAGGRGWLVAGVVIAVAALSRAAVVFVLYTLAPARQEGRSAEAGRPGRSTLLQAAAAGFAIFTAVLWPVATLPAMVGMALAGLAGLVAVCGLAHRLIGGQTGDVCGSAQVVTELAMLVAASTLVG